VRNNNEERNIYCIIVHKKTTLTDESCFSDTATRPWRHVAVTLQRKYYEQMPYITKSCSTKKNQYKF